MAVPRTEFPTSTLSLLAVLALLALAACRAPLASASSARAEPLRPPNVVLVFTDDQGWGDLGCYGAADIPTPHIDQLAAEGARFTDFYVSQAVCSASRASLLTGCYAERVGIQGALNPRARIGLHPDEETLAELLRARGYATGAFGKWHLGHHDPFLPQNQGFDEYFGLPYSNDMWPVGYDGRAIASGGQAKGSYPELRWIEGAEPAEPVANLESQAQITEQLTQAALAFIERHRNEPFFLYLPHSLPHVPLGRPLQLAGASERGPYGDVIAEIDASTGRILAALEKHGLTDDTLVIFTSDNGPWLNYGDHAGSTGGLREGKGTMWEGGARVPCVMRWPGRIAAGSVRREVAATIDLLPTIAAITGARLPELPIDGIDLSGLIEGRTSVSPRDHYLYYYGGELVAVRRGPWKLVFPHTYRSYVGVEPGTDGFPGPYARGRSGLELYDLGVDPRETTDLAHLHPEVVAELEAVAEVGRAELGDRLRGVRGAGVRPPGRLAPGRPSPIDHLAVGADLELIPAPSPKYAGVGPQTLVDGILGSEDFRDGTWLGFQGQRVELVVDLGTERELGRLSASFLRDQSAWIFAPAAVEFGVSETGAEFERVGRFERAVEPDGDQEIEEFSARFERRRARFVRLSVEALECPEWHAGAGSGAWLFLDELVVADPERSPGQTP